MLQAWEDGLIGNNAAKTARLPRKVPAAKIVINAPRARRIPGTTAASLATAA